MSEHHQVSDLMLEQYRLNELPSSQRARVAELLDRDSELRARLAALAESDRVIQEQYPPALLAQQIRRRIHADDGASAGQRAWRARRMAPAALAAVTLAAVATVLIAVIPAALDWGHASTSGADAIGSAGGTDASGDRIKGSGPSLTVFRRTPRGSETLADGDVGHAGDLIRLGYKAAGRSFGVIVSLDGRGSVTVHLPASGNRAAALTPGGIVLLDRAYELDDAPRWERFYLVTSSAPFAADSVVDAARRAAVNAAVPPEALPLPRTLDQSGITLQKEVKP